MRHQADNSDAMDIKEKFNLDPMDIEAREAVEGSVMAPRPVPATTDKKAPRYKREHIQRGPRNMPGPK